MAQRRMFSKEIVRSDAFLDMPVSSQLLYFHLGMEADDEGFVGNNKMIARTVGVGDDDLKILLAKRFVLPFPTGVVVIKHWLIHNTVRMDRFRPTRYETEKGQLFIKENKAYTDLATNGKPFGNQRVPQVKLSKVNSSKTKTVEIKRESSLEFLRSLNEEDLKEISEKYAVTKEFIFSKADDLYLYCQSKGKTYKNYKAFLLNAIKRDRPKVETGLTFKKY